MNTVIFLVGLVAGFASLAYFATAIWCLLRFYPRPQPPPSECPPVSVLKPLCGADERLDECIRSFCIDDAPGAQIIFGAQSPRDSSIAVVRRLMDEFPDRDISLVMDERIHGANLKVSNLINLMERARHELVVISDADTILPSGGLHRVLAPFAAPDVAVVTCLYKSSPESNLPSALGGLLFDYWILTSDIVNEALRPVDYCFGSLTALRRSALDKIGGLATVADHTADDFMLGRNFARAGYRVPLSDVVVSMLIKETWRAMIKRERRWLYCVKAATPIDHFVSLITRALPLTCLTAFGPSRVASCLIGTSVVLRLALHGLIRRRLSTARILYWIVPVREVLCFAVWVSSYFSRDVAWCERNFRIARGGVMIPIQSRT